MHEKSVELLNKAVADEMSAVHQYMYFHFHCDDQGLDLLAGLFKRTAIEEMMHVEMLAERITVLSKGHVVEEGPRDQILHDYNRWANECAANADSATKKIFEELVQQEERHFDQYDNELEHLTSLGTSYLALQSIERSKRQAAGPGGGMPPH